jgi:hypothetical protein
MPDLSDEFIRALAGVEVWNVPHDGPLAPNPDAIRLLHRWRRINPHLVATQGADLHHRAAFKPIRLALDLARADERAIVRALAEGRFEVSFAGFRFFSLVRAGALRLFLFDRAGRLIRYRRRRQGVLPPGAPTAPARRPDPPR